MGRFWKNGDFLAAAAPFLIHRHHSPVRQQSPCIQCLSEANSQNFPADFQNFQKIEKIWKNRKNLKNSQNRQKPRFSFAKIRISQCFLISKPIFWPGRAEKNGPEIDDNFLVPAANRPTDVSAPIGHPRVISCFEGHRAGWASQSMGIMGRGGLIRLIYSIYIVYI